MQNMEQKRRQLEESQDSLNEELAKLRAQGTKLGLMVIVSFTNCISQNSVLDNSIVNTAHLAPLQHLIFCPVLVLSYVHPYCHRNMMEQMGFEFIYLALCFAAHR